jgi:hypothetical protein
MIPLTCVAPGAPGRTRDPGEGGAELNASFWQGESCRNFPTLAPAVATGL